MSKKVAVVEDEAELASLIEYNLTAPSRLLKAAVIELDRSSCQVKLAGENLTLTATEFRLPEFLISRPGVVFSREQLLNAVWGQDRAVTDRTLDVYVLRLRQKVEQYASAPRLIHAVRHREASMEVVAGSRLSVIDGLNRRAVLR
jgi:DNA-binding response OmpR family regulator